MFHDSFRTRHCLVIADSFYEWKTLADGKKQPYRIMLKSCGRHTNSFRIGNSRGTFAMVVRTSIELFANSVLIEYVNDCEGHEAIIDLYDRWLAADRGDVWHP